MVNVIAEIGLAHEGSFELAKKLIDDAVWADTDTVKFQVYKTKELIDEKKDPVRFKRFKEKELSYRDFDRLNSYCKKIGIEFLATPHTIGAFKFLETLGVERYKVGSGDRGEILKEVVKTGKEVLVSLGMRDQNQIFDLVSKYDATFLHCITEYPADPRRLDLGYLRSLNKICNKYEREWGYSDHSVGDLAICVAVGLGAQVIEKHIKSKESTGQDIYGALGKDKFRQMVKKVRLIEEMLGDGIRHYTQEEKENEKWALKGKNGKRPYVSLA